MNVISVLIGLVALLWALVAFIPLLGGLYWIVIPFAMIGYAFGAMSRGRAGRALNLMVIVVGMIRLIIGHGII